MIPDIQHDVIRLIREGASDERIAALTGVNRPYIAQCRLMERNRIERMLDDPDRDDVRLTPMGPSAGAASSRPARRFERLTIG